MTQDEAQSAFPAVHLEGHTVLSYGELAGLASESERVLRHDGKALVDISAAERAPVTLGTWSARYANCPAGRR